MSNGQQVPSVEHFRQIIGQESKNLNSLCERWTKVLEQGNGNSQEEDFSGAIRTSIGQAKLLMSQRFKQFSELIDHCELKTGPQETRLDDLSGFWDMISFQVTDVMKKFKSLEEQLRMD